MTRTIIALSAFAVAILITVPAALSDVPGRHPAYLHARSDLRRAEILMEWPDFRNVRHHLDEAQRHIHEAVREIDAAARWDRKDLEDRPRVDTYSERAGRFRAIVRFLYTAKRDIDREEDNPPARAWRNRAIRHIDEAINAVHRAAHAEWRDDWLR